MSGTANMARLKAHILARSSSSDFQTACREWRLLNVYVTEDWDNCPCGQDIKEHCEIVNQVTGLQTYVGNVCINRFLNLHTATLFAGLKRVKAKPSANANEALIAYAQERGFLFGQERAFLLDTARKRDLSEKQLAWKEKINRRIVERIVVRRLPSQPVASGHDDLQEAAANILRQLEEEEREGR